MGCGGSREVLSDEESYLVSHEHELLYNTQTSSQVDLVFRKYSYDNSLNTSQLTQAAIKLGIRIDNIGTCNQIKPLYTSLKTGGDNTPLQSLLLLGVLLTQGDPREKARLLFEIYDRVSQEEIKAAVVESLVMDLYEIAMIKLSGLVGTKINSSEAAHTKQYLAKIDHIKGVAGKKLTEAIVGDAPAINKAEFIATLSSSRLRKVLTSSGFRGYFFNEYTASSKEVKAAFDAKWIASSSPPVLIKAGTSGALSLGSTV
jgi:hypothetical protein